jgi:hypothetical protein
MPRDRDARYCFTVCFVAGDRLGIVNEDPADATLAGVSLTFAGTRGS